MTPTSGIRQGSSRTFPGTRGFTLLELVVVLALLGLATALVAPSGMRMIESWRRASDVDASLGTLGAMGARVRETGRSLRLEPGPVPAQELPGLPDGWTVVLHEALEVQANGACGDSSGELSDATGYVQPFVVRAPFCRAAREEDG